MIERVWTRIGQCEGEIFKQIRGKEFTYTIKGNAVFLNATNRSISIKECEKALQLVPFENTVPLQNFQAPSYLFAILMDERIRKNDW